MMGLFFIYIIKFLCHKKLYNCHKDLKNKLVQELL